MSEIRNEADEDLRKSRDVFISILTEGGPTHSSSTSSVANAAQAFNSRIQDKRLNLENLDRARPIPAHDSLAAQKIRRRDARLIKKSRRRLTPSLKATATAIEKERNDTTSNKPLSRRQRKRIGLDEVDDKITYESLLQVHNLWLGYIQRLLGLIDQNDQINPSFLASSSSSASPTLSSANQSAIQSTIVKADFSGAPIRVIRAKNPSLVGLEGIVAKESGSTFQLMSKPKSHQHHNEGKRRKNANVIKIIPKQECVFVLQITLPGGQAERIDDPFASEQGKIEITLYGNQLCNTLPTRATKKFKARKTIELGK